MSNPFRAPTIALTDAQKRLRAVPVADYSERRTEELLAVTKKSKDLEVIRECLEHANMRIAKTFYVPRSLTVDPQVKASKHDTLAAAHAGKPVASEWSTPAKEQVNSFYEALCDVPIDAGVWNMDWRAMCEAKMSDTCFINAGAEWTMGRFERHFPSRKVPSYFEPVTKAEASVAVLSAGLSPFALLSDNAPFPIVPNDDQVGITINPRSDNGFPVLGKWSDSEAKTLSLRLAVTVRREIVAAFETGGYKGVERWKEEKERENPELVTLRGKAKADYYSFEKVITKQLRFTNTYPRHIALNIAPVTQKLKSIADTVFDSPSVHNISGVSLAKSGAERLIDRMEAELDREGYAFLTQGDDSFVVVRLRDGRLCLFALDGTCFDLTQRDEATAPIKDVLRDQLGQIDAPSSALWRAFMASRRVVLAGTLQRRMRDGGPSGGMFQSEVNDCLQSTAIRRVLRAWANLKEENEEEINALIEHVALGLGLKMRVEQFRVSDADTLRGALAQQPFLFVGYYFYTRVDDSDDTPYSEVLVFSDMPRVMSQLIYPRRYLKKGMHFEVTEALRCGNICLNVGIPPEALDTPYTVWRKQCIADLRAVKRKYRVDSLDDVEWDLEANTLGVSVISSIDGLINALESSSDDFWVDSEYVPQHADKVPNRREGLAMRIVQRVEASSDWLADEDNQRPPVHVNGVLTRSDMARYPVVDYKARPDSTRPATHDNDGRPPPTKVWAEPKLPRARMHEEEKPTTRRHKIAHIMPDDADHDRYASIQERLEEDQVAFEDEEDGVEIDQDEAADMYGRSMAAARKANRLAKAGGLVMHAGPPV